jgi:hypothetical protein
MTQDELQRGSASRLEEILVFPSRFKLHFVVNLALEPRVCHCACLTNYAVRWIPRNVLEISIERQSLPNIKQSFGLRFESCHWTLLVFVVRFSQFPPPSILPLALFFRQDLMSSSVFSPGRLGWQRLNPVTEER